MSYHLMKEGTGGLSPPMTKRLAGFGAELVPRPGANKNAVHVPMPGAGGQCGSGLCWRGIWYVHGEGRKQVLGHRSAKVTPLPCKGVEGLP